MEYIPLVYIELDDSSSDNHNIKIRDFGYS